MSNTFFVLVYEIVVAANPGDLSDKVTSLCQKGYVPLGGPLLEPDPISERNQIRYLQAVVVYGSTIE